MVERYNAVGYDPGMTATHGGSWVRHSDYEALERELAEARAERDTLAMHLEAKAILAKRDNTRLREAGENLVRFFDATGLDTNFLGELRAALRAMGEKK